MEQFMVVYLLAVNLVGVYIMWEDKRRAKKNLWRISEKTLFLVAFLGGAFGTTYGMYRFHHKTKHWYFKYGFSLLSVLEFGFLCFALYSRIKV